MNKHLEPLFQKSNVSSPGMIKFSNIFITPPKTFQFGLGVAGNEILTLSALYRSCQFLPLSDRTNSRNLDFCGGDVSYSGGELSIQVCF